MTTIKEKDKKELLLKKLDRLIAQAKHECTTSANIDAQRYLKKVINWVNKNL